MKSENSEMQYVSFMRKKRGAAHNGGDVADAGDGGSGGVGSGRRRRWAGWPGVARSGIARRMAWRAVGGSRGISVGMLCRLRSSLSLLGMYGISALAAWQHSAHTSSYIFLSCMLLSRDSGSTRRKRGMTRMAGTSLEVRCRWF